MGNKNSKSKNQDLSKKIPEPFVENRRLDALARLIEAGTGATCIAIAVANGSFVIAENSLHIKSKGKGKDTRPKIIEDIEEIYKYFQEIAKSLKEIKQKTELIDKHSDKRKNIFKKICFHVSHGKDFTYLKSLGEKDSNKLIEDILQERDSPWISGRIIHQFAHGAWLNLYTIFVRLENSILVNLEKEKISEERVKKIQEYRTTLEKAPIILRTQSNEGVHAELQIINYLLNETIEKVDSNASLAKNFYIGVSKLCCQKCDDTIVRINTVLNRKDFSIEKIKNYKFNARGYHKLIAGHDKWVSPDMLRKTIVINNKEKKAGFLFKDYDKLINEEFQFALSELNKNYKVDLTWDKIDRHDAIGDLKEFFELKTNLKQLREEINGRTGYNYIPLNSSYFASTKNIGIHVGTQEKENNMIPSPSNSWISHDIENLVNIFGYCTEIKEEKWPKEKETLLKKTEIVLELSRSNIFKTAVRFGQIENQEEFLLTIASELKAKEIKVSDDFLKNLMEDPIFVGERIANLFSIDSGHSSQSFKSQSNVESDKEMETVLQESIKTSEKEGTSGPRKLPNWELKDVEGKGNCFYLAVVDQLIKINHEFMKQIPPGTEDNDSLRLLIQKEKFKDQEWAGHPEIIELCKQLNVIVAVVDTRNPNLGFVYHYINNKEESDFTKDLKFLPTDKPIIKIAFTGTHYLSVIKSSEFDVSANKNFSGLIFSKTDDKIEQSKSQDKIISQQNPPKKRKISNSSLGSESE